MRIVRRPATPRRRHLASVLLVVLALVAAACGDGDPESRLAEAFEDTFEGEFAYAFTVEADRNALDALGEGAGQAAAFLSGFGATGVVQEDAASFSVEILGANLLEVRTIGDEAFYLQLGLNDLLAAFGGGAFDPRDELVPALDALDLSEEVQTTVLDALDGRWVGVEGELDPQRFAELMGGEAATEDPEATAERVRELFGEDVPAFFERYVIVEEEVEEDDTTRYRVLLQVHELLRAAAELDPDTAGAGALDDLEADLADLPETVPGSVVVNDGLVTSIRFDIADAAREAGTTVDGSVLLRLDLSDHGDVPDVEAPEAATVLTAEQFSEALASIAALTGVPAGP